MTKKRMESHYRLEAILVLDDKLESFVLIDFFFALDKNGLSFKRGSLLQPRTDVSPSKR